jgi:surface carbohydrate biosynthesis protein
VIFDRLRRLVRIARSIASAKKVWALPKASDVLIFDDTNRPTLMEFLQPWSPEVLHVRGEYWNVPVGLLSLLRRGNRKDAYYDAFVGRVSPKLIVTLIDNSLDFFRLSRRHPSIKTVMIQNGWRSYFADVFSTLDGLSQGQRRDLKVDHMLVFGPVVGARYGRFIDGSVTSIGSLKNNKIAVTPSSQTGVIAFISQWGSSGIQMGDRYVAPSKYFSQVDGPILRFISRYAAGTDKRLLIVPRHLKGEPRRSAEEAYYAEILGSDADFLEYKGEYQCYRSVDEAEIVVTVDSTVGYEAIARGKKTAMFSVRSEILGLDGLSYGWPGDFPDTGLFWTNRSDDDEFERILEYLDQASHAQWEEDVDASGFKDLMLYDSGNSILKALLSAELGIESD